MLDITMLPARQGDALWIRWGEKDKPHQMIIDMGTEQIGTRIRKDLLSLPEDQRIIDLLIVTHVDRDHIGGVLTCLAESEPIPGLIIKDVWFNGFNHLSGGSFTQSDDIGNEDSSGGNSLEPMGPAQGERLSSWLRKQTWNKAFDGGPVICEPDKNPPTINLFDNLSLTILGPTPSRLEDLIETWVEDVQEALEKGTLTEVSPGLEPMGAREPPVLETEADLEILAESINTRDQSKANGSSIALLLEYKGKKVILAGDAYPDDLVDSIKAISNGERIKLDAFKLSHHCSKKSVNKKVVEAVDCERWLISTDGTQFRHPDAIALARVISYSKVRPPLLSFNVPSKFNGWWDNDDWRTLYDYKTEYGTKEDGLTLLFNFDDE